jgi:hypothetical protein
MDDNHIGDPTSKFVSDLKEGIVGAGDLAGKARTMAAEAGNTIRDAAIETGNKVSLDGHIRLMSFYICRGVDDQVIWFTAIFPAIKWGPQEQALAFRTRGHAQQALAKLPKNASRGAKIVDGGTSSAI